MIDLLNWVWVNLPWILIGVVAHGTILGTVAYLILLERKTASWVQDRIGPNRVGLDFGLPFAPKFLKNVNGFGQPLADGVKFIMKEDYRPKGVDKILFTIAPGIMIIVIILSIAVLPWGGWKQSNTTVTLAETTDHTALVADVQRDAAVRRAIPATAEIVTVAERQETVDAAAGDVPKVKYVADVVYRYPFQIANLNIGVLFILATLSLAVYGVVIGGWASNNKYSFLGGLRATANMISYEVPLGLVVLCIVLMFGTMDLAVIVDKQAHYWGGFFPAWNVFSQPLAFIMFLICIHAEANRAPFDTAEAEQELVGGYHTEYSAMRFALFFLAEYAGMITTSAVCVALFLGGWHLPFMDQAIVFATNLLGAGNDPINPAEPSITTSLIVCLARAGVFFGKTIAIVFIFMWVRWSLPRFRFDQIMVLAWRAMIPISLAMVMMTATVIYYTRDMDHAHGRMSGSVSVILLLANVALIVLTMLISLILPAPADTNRKLHIPNSRFAHTPLPGKPIGVPALNRAAVVKVAVDPIGAQGARMGT